MGVNHFFKWLREKYSDCIENIIFDKTEKIENKIPEIDTLLLDMNGIFHMSTQKIHEYGNCKPLKPLLKRKNTFEVSSKIPLDANGRLVFENVIEILETILIIVKPRKRLIICVDGVAPSGKQNQQRKRRFLSSLSRKEDEFDPNCLSPGTKYMFRLTQYLQEYIETRISSSDELKNFDWSVLKEVVFSNERVPGEGEQKLLRFLRLYNDTNDSICLYGMDADLIMLGLVNYINNLYIIRDSLSSYCNYHLVNISDIRNRISFCNSKPFLIDNFVLLCFFFGNDFLPMSPTLEIPQSDIEILMKYEEPIVEYSNFSQPSFNINSFSHVLKIISEREKENLERRIGDRKYFYDSCLTNSLKYDGETLSVDVEKYKKCYYKKIISEKNLKDLEPYLLQICQEYMTGMLWVFTYYKKDVPDWNWRYPFSYAPFASTLLEYITKISFLPFTLTMPKSPYQQLLSILPPKSSELLPFPLCKKLKDFDFSKEASKIRIDLEGKQNKLDEIVLVPNNWTLNLFKDSENDKTLENDICNRVEDSILYTILPGEIEISTIKF